MGTLDRKVWITALSLSHTQTSWILSDSIGMRQTQHGTPSSGTSAGLLPCSASPLREKMRRKGVPSLSILEYVGTLATFPLLCTRCFPDVLDMPSLGDNVYAMMGPRPPGESIGTAYLCSFTSRLSSTLN